jgi:hypothetical protein
MRPYSIYGYYFSNKHPKTPLKIPSKSFLKKKPGVFMLEMYLLGSSTDGVVKGGTREF